MPNKRDANKISVHTWVTKEARWPFSGSFGSAFCATVNDAFHLAAWAAKAVIAMAA